MKKLSIFSICTILVLFFATKITAEFYPDNDGPKSYQCGNMFIEKGVHSFQVLQNCGEPTYQELYESGGYDDRKPYYIEKWIYGPEAGFYYILYFKYGVLFRLESVPVIW